MLYQLSYTRVEPILAAVEQRYGGGSSAMLPAPELGRGRRGSRTPMSGGGSCHSP
jgi:hypothetical protein